MGRVIVGLFLILLNADCYGQYTDSAVYYTGLISTGTYNKTQNTSNILFSNKLNAGVRRKDITLNWNNIWTFGEQQQTLTNNDFSSTFNCDVRKLFPHAYYWGLATYTTSFSLKINALYQVGAGVAYNILDRKNIRLNLSDGFVYDNSDIFINDTVREVYSTGRNSARFILRCNSSIFTVKVSALLQNSLSIRDDYIIKADVNFSVKIRKWLSFTTSYSYNRFNRTDKENTVLTYGLTIEHYY